ncbi:ead/Ea22-like family protein [Citrobacter sp. Cpo142]|uniref:ead/Ea22-like family protein n=1 Tax=Citrobacter sp. Cpo142 TaxID=2985151 RepID=UPI0025763405|nr:ead/Ea22-like family protein [Citrobacter sp. Cpo142]MDM2779263.1 ead/Ea22-like family protein [Citrobacter sp. Cpo142]
MTALNKQALRQFAEKATQGEWWSDVVETDGEYGEGEDRASGYHSYAVYVGSESLLDMTNSTAACIHEEWDHDYHMAWDETAKRNAEFIAAANPDTVLALLDENLQLQRDKDSLEAVSIAMRDDMRDAREKLEAADKTSAARLEAIDRTHKMFQRERDRADAAEKRIAELEARKVAVKQFDDFQIVHYGGSEDYAKGYTDCQNNYNKAIAAAGIGVKGE